MIKVGFTESEIETFKTSDLNVPTAEMKDHIKKIKKAMDNNPMFEDELIKTYDYSIFDDHQKVIEYLLFITMIIDGKNTSDEYNIYNIINESLEDPQEADFLYSGINMADYLDNRTEEEIINSTEVQIYNNPTVNNTEIQHNEELQEDNKTLESSWLNNIRIAE